MAGIDPLSHLYQELGRRKDWGGGKDKKYRMKGLAPFIKGEKSRPESELPHFILGDLCLNH